MCQDSCRNGSYGIFDTCPFPNTTGFDQNTCCILFDQVLQLARGVAVEVSENGSAEFSVVGFSTSAFYQYADGTTSNSLSSYTGPMMDGAGVDAAITSSDYSGGFTNHDRAIRWW